MCVSLVLFVVYIGDLKYMSLCVCVCVFLSRPGPAECLFEQPYYEKMKKALRPGGIICTQGLTCVC